jgi:hypothetical protein
MEAGALISYGFDLMGLFYDSRAMSTVPFRNSSQLIAARVHEPLLA